MPPSSPEATKASSPSVAKAASKNAKQSRLIILKLSSYLLTDFPHEPEVKLQPTKAKSAQASSSETPKPSAPSPVDKNEQSNSTPNPTTNGDAEAPLNKDGKRRGIPGPKPGQKRVAPATETDGTPKPRGKPGPKKRKVDGENGIPGPAPAPKLGPKANQGAINAQLRALDRTGTPCRRWGKRTVALKSFTGVTWDLPYWQTPRLKRDDLTNDARSQETSSSEAKNEPSSSQVPSETAGGIKESSNAPIDVLDVNVSESEEKTSGSAIAVDVEHNSTPQPVEA